MVKDSLGSRLKCAREARGLSSAALAEMANLTRGHVWMLETGKRRTPSAKTVSALAHALGVTVESLVDGDDIADSEDASTGRVRS